MAKIEKSQIKKSKIKKGIRKSWGDEVGDQLEEWFNRKLPDGTPLVPSSGDASTDIGQLIRGMNRIMYRYYNDGDIAGIGYGKETLDWVFDYMEGCADGGLSSELQNFYDKYSALDIDFESMDDYELEDYVNEALNTDFSTRYGGGDEPEEPDEPSRDDYESDEEYEEAMNDYQYDMEEYEREKAEYEESRENFDYYMDNPGAFAMDYGEDYIEQAIEEAENKGYEKDMIELGRKVLDYVETKWIQMYHLAQANEDDIDSYSTDSWDYYYASSKKMKKSIPDIKMSFTDNVNKMRMNNYAKTGNINTVMKKRD